MFNHEFPPIGGGGGQVSYFLGKHFAAAGHDIHLITSQFQDCVRREIVDGINVHRIRALRKSPNVCAVHEMLTYAISSSFYGLKFAKHFNPDIVQVFFGIPAGGGAYLLQKRRNIPYTIFLGGRDVPRPDPDPPYYRWLYLLLKPIICAIWDNAAVVVSCSDGLRDLAHETAPDLNIAVIPDGVDLETFAPTQRKTNLGVVRCLAIGRLIPRKGFQFLIRALPKVLDAVSHKFVLEIVGDGPYKSELVGLAESIGVLSYIHFAGTVPYSAISQHVPTDEILLPQKYREADIFILPSLTEGMPLVVLEAMGTGLPIIASRVQGIGELVEENVNGAVFEPGNVDELAECLITLINAGEKRIEMGKASIKKVKSYDWKNIADAYLKLYEDILS